MYKTIVFGLLFLLAMPSLFAQYEDKNTEAYISKIPVGFKLIPDAVPYNVNDSLYKVVEHNGDRNYLFGIEAGIIYYNLPKEKEVLYMGLNDGIEHGGCNIGSIVAYKDKTIVTLLVKPSFNVYWFSISDFCALIDPKTNNRYMIHSIKNNIPLGYPIFINRNLGRTLEFYLVFPPLKKGVKKVDFIEFTDLNLELPPMSSGLFRWENIKVVKEKKSMNNKFKGEIIRMELP